MNRDLLWVDCTAGAVVGTVVLLLSGWLGDLYGLPQEILIGTGVANLAYAAYSFSLARRRQRSVRRIQGLAVANILWGAVVCVGLAVVTWDTASGLGRAHFLAEAVFVAGLGVLEWRRRASLRTAA